MKWYQRNRYGYRYSTQNHQMALLQKENKKFLNVAGMTYITYKMCLKMLLKYFFVTIQFRGRGAGAKYSN